MKKLIFARKVSKTQSVTISQEEWDRMMSRFRAEQTRRMIESLGQCRRD